MSNIKLSDDQEKQIAIAMKQNKPHLLKIEEWIADTHDGYIEFKMEVRSGRVEKMTKFAGNYWVRTKDIDINPDI